MVQPHLANVARTTLASFALAALAGGVASASVVVPERTVRVPGAGVINQLKHIVTIGSTVDPTNGDQNPYGLTIAPVTSGSIVAGDLLIANFNNGNPFNIQGLGTTVEILHPTPGSMPTRLVQDPRLTGPSAMATSTTSDFPWVAAFTANGVPIVADSTSGGVV
ncbi:MAG: hypothetical protein ABI346_10030, partial [Candidatus Baltobacteraceae bacterium]